MTSFTDNDSQQAKTLYVFPASSDEGDAYDEAVDIARYLDDASEDELDAMMTGDYAWLLEAIDATVTQEGYPSVEDLDEIPWEHVYQYIFVLREARNA